MSVAYDIGFRERPKLDDLDEFMKSLGFNMDRALKRGEITRVYNFENGAVASRPIELFYFSRIDADLREAFGRENIVSFGILKTYSIEPEISDPKKRKRIITRQKIHREHDYYKHLEPDRLKWYETALAIRDEFGAVVKSEQTGDSINPNRDPFAWARGIWSRLSKK